MLFRLENKRKAKAEKVNQVDPKLQQLQAKLEQRKQERLKTSKEMKISPSKESAIHTKALISQKVRAKYAVINNQIACCKITDVLIQMPNDNLFSWPPSFIYISVISSL